MLLAFAGLAVSAAGASAATLNVVFDNTSPGASTGSAPFDADNADGNDSSASNHIVRSHDTITYHWAISANGGSSPDTTITQVLPVGVTWVNLPAYCLTTGTPVSSLSVDKRTLVCNTGTQGSSAVDYYPTALVGAVANGGSLTTQIDVTSSDVATLPVASAPITDVVSAAPRVNLRKQGFYSYNGSLNGVDGLRYSYSLALMVDNQGGKGMRGSETVTQPITFTEDVSAYLPDSTFVGFSGVSGGNVPWSYGTDNRSAPNSGSWTGTQAAAGANFTATITGADLTGTRIPTNSAGGGLLPANDQYLAVMIVEFFTPFTSIPNNVAVPFTNVVSNFNPVSATGQPNYGGLGEPLADNTVSGSYLKPTGEGGIAKNYYSDLTGTGRLTGSSGGNSADGLLFPGEVFMADHAWAARDGAPRIHYKPILCDNFDSSSLAINGPASFTSTPAANWVIEYTGGGVRGATPTTWNAVGGPRDTHCEDADAGPGGWVTDPTAVPGGTDNITSVRLRATSDQTGVTFNFPHLYVKYTVRLTDKYNGDAITVGRKIANFMQFGEAADAVGPRVWRTNTYDPLVNNNVMGAVASINGGIVRISKDTAPSGQISALTGSIVDFSLQPSATSPIPIGGNSSGFLMHNIKVVDTIPSNMTFQAGSSNVTPDSVVVNGNNTTTVTWSLPDAPVNTTLPPITYQARVKLTTPNGAQEVNSVVISSTDDPSRAIDRTDTYTIRVDKVFGIVVGKSTSTPWIEPLDQAEFSLEYVNNAADAVTSLDVIDVLPYNGDDRGADSAFHGTATLASASTADPTDVVYYTARGASLVSNNPKAASNALPAGATQWCTTVQLGSAGCPATVAGSTAVRVIRTGAIASGDGGTLTIVMNTAGNESGDRYINDAGIAAGGVTLPAFALPVRVDVVASNLGNFVWDDTNKNGIQDAGEPGIAGVTVTLTGTDKDNRAVNTSATTDSAGRYTFASASGGFTLRSGDYHLTFVAPSGYEFTLLTAGSDAEVDSNAGAGGVTSAITLISPVPGQVDIEDVTYDAGLVKLPPVVIVPPAVPAVPSGAVAPDAGGVAAGAAGSPKLTLVKTASKKRVNAGGKVKYTLLVTNTGSGAATKVTLCDTLPGHLTLLSKAGGTLSKGRLCWTIGSLAAGAKATKAFNVRIDRNAKAASCIINRANVRSAENGSSATAKRSVCVDRSAVSPTSTSKVTG